MGHCEHTASRTELPPALSVRRTWGLQHSCSALTETIPATARQKQQTPKGRVPAAASPALPLSGYRKARRRVLSVAFILFLLNMPYEISHGTKAILTGVCLGRREQREGKSPARDVAIGSLKAGSCTLLESGKQNLSLQARITLADTGITNQNTLNRNRFTCDGSLCSFLIRLELFSAKQLPAPPRTASPAAHSFTELDSPTESLPLPSPPAAPPTTAGLEPDGKSAVTRTEMPCFS